MMDYFRRPLLSGRNLQHLDYATIRGALRRSDADINSAVPYFPGVTGSDHLQVSVNGASALNISLPGNGLDGILSALNTALGVSGGAFEGDGSIYLRSNTPGALGSISVTGGTAAPKLGFDTTTGTQRSVGGDLDGAPEGRIGNPYGAVFPGKGENFVMSSIRNSLGRIAGNVDVLYSNMTQQGAALRQVPMPTSSPIDSTHTLLTLVPSLRVFTGFGASLASTKESLAAYFVLIDQVTRQPAASKVVDVILGSTSSPPPYTQATNWADVGDSVVGVDVLKASAAIDSIKDNRVVYCSAASFSTNVQAGDFAEIVGLDSTTLTVPWDNRGYRWVVDQVVDNSHLSLRPMSKAELAMVGFSGGEQQPVLELNDATLTGGKTYGSINIHSGSFCQNLSLVVSPAVPVGATYDLWVTVPDQAHGGFSHQTMTDLTPLARSLVEETKHQPDGFVLAPTVTQVSSPERAVVSSFYVRRSGKVYYLPSVNYTPASIGVGVTTYIYWDPDSNLVKTTTDPSIFANFPPDATPGPGPVDPPGASYGHLIGILHAVGGHFDLVLPAPRSIAEAAREVTVGWGGQFTGLGDAVRYANAWAAGRGETTLANGTYPHFTITLLNNIEEDYEIPINFPGLHIRGANPNVTLTTGDNFLTFNSPGVAILEDFRFVGLQGSNFIKMNAPVHAIIRNVHQDLGGQSIGAVAVGTQTDLTPNPGYELTVSDSTFLCGTVAQSMNRVILDSSEFFCRQDSLVNEIFKGVSGYAYSGDYIIVKHCKFNNWVNDGTLNMLVDSYSNLKFWVEDTDFSFGTFADTYGGLFANSSTGVFKNVRFTTPYPGGIQGGAGVFLQDCTFLNDPRVAGQTLYKVERAEGCSFAVDDSHGTCTNLSILELFGEGKAINNVIGGAATTVISNYFETITPVIVSGNTLNMGVGTNNTSNLMALSLTGGSFGHMEVTHNRFLGGYKTTITGACMITHNVFTENVSYTQSGQSYTTTFIGNDITVGGLTIISAFRGSAETAAIFIRDSKINGTADLNNATPSNYLPWIDVANCLFLGDVTVGRGKMRDCYVAGALAGTGGTPFLELRSCEIVGATSSLSVSEDITDCRFSGAISTTSCSRFINNTSVATCTLTSAITVAQCLFNNACTLSSTNEVTNNIFDSSFTLSSSNHGNVSGCRFGSTVSATCERFSNNLCLQAVEIDGAQVSGNTINSNASGTSTFNAAQVTGNLIGGDVSIGGTRLIGNEITGALIIDGDADVSGNYINGDLYDGGDEVRGFADVNVNGNYIGRDLNLSHGVFDHDGFGVTISSNRVFGCIQISGATSAEVSGNLFSGPNGGVGANYFSSIPSLTLTGNTFLSTVNQELSSVLSVSNNQFVSAIFHGNHYGTPDRFTFSNNYFSSTAIIGSVDPAHSYRTVAQITGNNFMGMLYCGGLDDSQVHGNKIVGASGLGWSGALTLAGCNRMTVCGNTILTTGPNGSCGNAIFITFFPNYFGSGSPDHSDGVTIVGNYMKHFEYSDYDFLINAPAAHRVVIIGNTFERLNGYKIASLGSPDFPVQRCFIGPNNYVGTDLNSAGGAGAAYRDYSNESSMAHGSTVFNDATVNIPGFTLIYETAAQLPTPPAPGAEAGTLWASTYLPHYSPLVQWTTGCIVFNDANLANNGLWYVCPEYTDAAHYTNVWRRGGQVFHGLGLSNTIITYYAPAEISGRIFKFVDGDWATSPHSLGYYKETVSGSNRSFSQVWAGISWYPTQIDTLQRTATVDDHSYINDLFTVTALPPGGGYGGPY
jgi:hypothetical protein